MKAQGGQAELGKRWLTAAALGLALGAAAQVTAADVPAPGSVRLPQRLMFGHEILEELHAQTGLRYAYPSGALTRQIDATPFEGEVKVEALLPRLAPRVSMVAQVALLEAELPADRLADLAGRLAGGPVDERRAAAYMLGLSQSSRAIGPLAAALDDADSSVRHYALRALVRLEDDFRAYSPAGRVSIFALERRLPAAKLLAVMKNATGRETLAWTDAAELCGRVGDAVVAEELRQGIADGYAGTRLVASWALTRLAGENPSARRPAQETTAALLRREPPARMPEPRAAWLMELGRAGGTAAWDILLREVTATNEIVRQAAIQALRRCPEARAVPVLLDIVTGTQAEGDDRQAAAMSLGLIGSDTAVTALVAHVEQAARIYGNVPLALGYTRDRRAVPALIKCARAESETLKSYAFTALAAIGTREAAAALAGLRNQYDNVARYMGHAAVRLAGSWHQEAVDYFVEKTRGGGRFVPHGLEMAGDPRGVDALLAQLPGSSGERRLWIVQALGRMGDPKATPTMIAELGKGTANEQYQVMRTLRWRWYWTRPEVQAAMRAHPVFRAFTGTPPSLDEQEENTWVPRRWPVDLDDDRMCATTYEAGLVCDERSGRIFKWGSHGARCDSPQLADTWLYDPASNLWSRSASAINPFGMCGTWGMAYDRANACIVSLQLEGANHGWQWSRARTLRPAVPWVYFSGEERWVPMKPHEPDQGPGLRGFLPLVYHDRAQVVLLHGGQGGNFRNGPEADQAWVYDAFANSWTLLPPAPLQPGARAHHGMCYLPEQDRVLLVGGSYGRSDNRTWLYDIERNTWVDAQPKGVTPKFRLPVVYDPVTRTALKFEDSVHGAAVWQYDPAANEWRKQPTPVGATPHHDSAHVAYDPVHNVYFMDGGHLGWETDHIGVSEVWSYKFKRRTAAPQPAAGDMGLTVVTALEQGRRVARLAWRAAESGQRVLRGTGPSPWRIVWETLAELPAGQAGYLDADLPPAAETLYYAVAVGGERERRSLTVRTQPPFPRGVVASVLADRSVQVSWDAAGAPDVVGYRVYAATVEPGEFHFRSVYRRIQPLKPLSDVPLRAPLFVDTRPLAGASRLFDHEIRAYEVRAINSWGIESGPSATVLSLPSSVPGVTAVELPDGTTAVRWQANPETGLRGYRVYRMDEHRATLALRLNPVPVREEHFIDRPEFPRYERRRYYVVAVDALGQEGLPSTGAWSFGRP